MAGVLGGALGFAGCTLLNPLSDYDRGGPKIDASTDVLVAQDSGPDAIEAACTLARWPARPSADNEDGGTSDLTYITAFNKLDFGEFGDGGSLIEGFDLDNVCTCPGPESCMPKGKGVPHCDFAGGFDNAAGDLVLRSVESSLINQNIINNRLGEGGAGLLLTIKNYNGTANDSHVEVSIFRSPGTARDDAGKHVPPLHDGNDKWLIDRSSVKNSSSPYLAVAVDDDAYVANSKLVARADFPLGLGQLTIELQGTTVVGTLSKAPDGGIKIDRGIIGGRWPSSNVLTSLEGVRDPANAEMFLCGKNTFYQGLKLRICEAADIASDFSKGTCDALSLALQFASEPAQFGDLEDASPPVRGCGNLWKDDCK